MSSLLVLPYIPAVLLSIVLAVQLFNRRLLSSQMQYLFWISVLIVLALLSYESGAQYFAWLGAGSPTMYLLPPYQPISYFLMYVGVRMWLPYLVALAFGGIAFLTAKYLNKKYSDRFFYPEEPYLIALGMFLCGHPLWLAFLIATAALYILYSLIVSLTRNLNARASFYYFWLPAALLVILCTFLIPDSLLRIFQL